MLTLMYLTALAQVGISVLCLRGTSPFADCGAEKYERRRIRRTVGQTLLTGGVLWGFLALFGTVYS